MKGLALSLIDALTAPKPGPEPKSRVAQILEKVTWDEREALEAALRGSEWTHEGLAELLTAQGHSVSESSVRRYRRASK